MSFVLISTHQRVIAFKLFAKKKSEYSQTKFSGTKKRVKKSQTKFSDTKKE